MVNLTVKQHIDKYIGRIALAILIVPVRLLGLLLRRNHAIEKEPDNILVIKILGIGSILMAADSIYSIRIRYPNAKLTLLCSNSVKQGIEPLGLFDSILTINDASYLMMLKSGTQALFSCLKMKRLWILDLEVYSVLTTIFSACTMGINRFGFQVDKVNFRNYLNTNNVYFNQFISAYKNYENIAKAMGVASIEPFTFLSNIAKNDMQADFVAINNTCSELGGNLRKLPEEKLVRICDNILNNCSLKIALLGAPSDKNENDAFISKYFADSDRIENIAGKYKFADYFLFLKKHCKAMITIDSAPFHIAVKLDLPSLSLWGPIHPNHRLDFDAQTRHINYYLQCDCSPCIHHSEIVPCNGNNICMKQMDVNQINLLINKLLQ